MSPIERPSIAQPIVTQKLPPRLTKEAIDKRLLEEREKRLNILGKDPVRQFLMDVNLFWYVEQTAVPQWLYVDEEIVQALSCLATHSSLLHTYKQGLLQHKSYHRLASGAIPALRSWISQEY